MTPAGDIIIQCPHCGEKKQVLQIGSGNTFGATWWSDGKADCPMLPQHSQVQRCPKCRHYYFAYKSGVGSKEVWDDGNQFHEGWLPLEYLKEALVELFPEFPQKKSALSSLRKVTDAEKEQMLLRTYILWAFNDRYGEYQIEEIPQTEWQFFIRNCEALINLGVDVQTEAELYRELGLFDRALKTIMKLEVKNEDDELFRKPFMEKLTNRDRKVFVIVGDAKRHELTLDAYLKSDDQ